ncbi:hypothetical protein WG66_011239 [Moniliophthora roreri]|nr:hypothetical protein WG66_011239 [Moniliophthora roreri]
MLLRSISSLLGPILNLERTSVVQVLRYAASILEDTKMLYQNLRREKGREFECYVKWHSGENCPAQWRPLGVPGTSYCEDARAENAANSRLLEGCYILPKSHDELPNVGCGKPRFRQEQTSQLSLIVSHFSICDTWDEMLDTG